jgi:putative FmdB family regulatory protein
MAKYQIQMAKWPRYNVYMPLFEFACRGCGHRFEYLTRQGQTPTCPKCAATDLEKQLSVFAVSSSAQSAYAAPSGPCGSCGDPRGPGACSMN